MEMFFFFVNHSLEKTNHQVDYHHECFVGQLTSDEEESCFTFCSISIRSTVTKSKTRWKPMANHTVCGQRVQSGTQVKNAVKNPDALSYSHLQWIYSGVAARSRRAFFSLLISKCLFIESHLQPAVFAPCVCAPDIRHFFYNNGPLSAQNEKVFT